jgi:hypothetical protein
MITFCFHSLERLAKEEARKLPHVKKALREGFHLTTELCVTEKGVLEGISVSLVSDQEKESA